MPVIGNVEHTIHNSPKVVAALRKLAAMQVMVGIPATRGPRAGTPITNATLGYIHEFGAPSVNIPPRPFLRPGVKNAQTEIAKRLLSAGRAAVDGNEAAMRVQLEAAGMAASNSVKRKITDGPFVPLSPYTIQKRMAKIAAAKGKPLTAAERAQGFKDIRPLIDTGQLRAAITYVVRFRGKDV